MLTGDLARQLAAEVLVEGGHLMKLNNNGMGIGNDADAAAGKRTAHHQYLKAQLKDGSSFEAWRRSANMLSRWANPSARADALLQPLDTTAFAEDSGALRARRERAQSLLSSSNRQRAQELGLRVYTVVFEDPKTGKTAVAVRAGPSRSARIVAVRHKGEEVIVAEEVDGWARVSEEDDEWGYHLATTSAGSGEVNQMEAHGHAMPSRICGDCREISGTGSIATGRCDDATGSARQAWMLIDGAEVGLGKLLERTV